MSATRCCSRSSRTSGDNRAARLASSGNHDPHKPHPSFLIAFLAAIAGCGANARPDRQDGRKLGVRDPPGPAGQAAQGRSFGQARARPGAGHGPRDDGHDHDHHQQQPVAYTYKAELIGAGKAVPIRVLHPARQRPPVVRALAAKGRRGPPQQLQAAPPRAAAAPRSLDGQALFLLCRDERGEIDHAAAGRFQLSRARHGDDAVDRQPRRSRRRRHDRLAHRLVRAGRRPIRADIDLFDGDRRRS